ncbi:helix-turn-helix transcriptional regulator [bacterium AH-315-I18]|nr:helix-turn-helix transcriptional regulator [Phycisphaeraceae bacterium]MBN4060998.1 helix-turn-helix transcriptional regulator [bacterium AH-315-I18]
MEPIPILEQTALTPFWSIWTHGRQICPPHEKYYWNNLERGPHDNVTLQYNLRGSCKYVERGHQFTVNQGQAFLFSYMEDSHYYLPDQRDSTYECLWLNLKGAGLREHWQYLRQQFGSIVTITQQSSIHRRIKQIIELSSPRLNTDPLEMATNIYGLVMMMTDEMRVRWQKTEPPVDQAIEQILQHPTGTWSLKSVAANFDISREHLTRRFIKKVGISPGRYLTQQKFQRAVTLLTETNLPIQQVAEQAGIGTAHTLIRQIQTAYGMTPTRYRQKYRKNQNTPQ